MKDLFYFSPGWQPKELVDYCRHYGDDQFDAPFPPSFLEEFPSLSLLPRESYHRWYYAEDTCIAFKMEGPVGEHTDEYTGGGTLFDLKTAALFWWFGPSEALFSTGSENCRLRAGDYVVFEDSKPHSLLTEGKWLGMAVQIAHAKLPKNKKHQDCGFFYPG